MTLSHRMEEAVSGLSGRLEVGMNLASLWNRLLRLWRYK